MPSQLPLRIPPLRSGGIMANYLCNSRCAHCAYFCGLHWSRDYITEPDARRAIRIVREAGCGSVHIGGGEPFLGGEKLPALIGWCREEGVSVDYVETNAGWFTNPESAARRLEALLDAGLRTLLVSMDPFHNEYIPWRKVQGVLDACRRTGMDVFPWTAELGAEVSRLDPSRTHTMDEYEETFGTGYLASIPDRHWISPRGRAVAAFRRFAKPLSADEAAASGGSGCGELFDTSHFHIDLYGNYVPGVCSGLSVALHDMNAPLDRDRYRYLTALIDGGPTKLLRMAREDGFVARDSYSGKCDLCYDIRRFLVIERCVDAPDLQPAELYRHMDG